MVFNCDLNWTTDVDWRTEAGRLFHSLGPETEKARLPNFRLVRITAKSLSHGWSESSIELEEEHCVTMDMTCMMY